MEWITQNWVWVLVAGAVAWLVLRGLGPHVFNASGTGGGANVPDRLHEHARPGQGGSHASDAALDPVSGKAVRTDQALSTLFRGQAYFFESKETREKFEAEPERFAVETGIPDASSSGQTAHRRRRGC